MNYTAILKLIQYCFGILILYPLVNIILYFNTEYRLLPYHKRCYVVKNIIKSFSLCLIFIFSIQNILIPIFTKDEWNNDYLYITAAKYVSNDIVGLLIIPKLPKTTLFHHITTTILVLYSFNIDFSKDNVGRWMLIYKIMSCMSFGVNAYLGLRFLTNNKSNFFNKFVDRLRIFSFYKYLGCCIINWSIHIYLIIMKLQHGFMELPYYMYLILLIPIIRDDVILMTWLYNKSR